MPQSTISTAIPDTPRFRHEALLYARPGEFVRCCSDFLHEGLEAGEAAVVVVPAPKIDWLRKALGDVAGDVFFADMADVGANPGRIIPAWRRFLCEHVAAGTPLRGIGEPIWAGRSEAELEECHRHESMLNLAFDGGDPWWLLCPYDTSALPPAVIDEAQRNHPYVWDGSAHHTSDAYAGPDVDALLDGPLPTPAGAAPEVAFAAADLGVVRRFVLDEAVACGLAGARLDDLVTAVNEVATNSLRHGGGRGVARIWCDGGTVVCEVRDDGRISEPLAGRRAPAANAVSGRGIWIAHQLCDLVQLRSNADGTTIRLQMRLPVRETAGASR